MIRRFALALALLALGAGCGSDEAPETVSAEPAAETGQADPPAGETASSAPPATDAPPPDAGDPESVVRAWSAALNAGDNEAAARLFAPNALVIQGSVAYQLATVEQATQWNAGLPCSGMIVEISTEDTPDGTVVTAVFVLGHRTTSQCDAPPGTKAAARFLIEDGLIQAWQQIPPPEEADTETDVQNEA
jgi:hypothetical protein